MLSVLQNTEALFINGFVFDELPAEAVVAAATTARAAGSAVFFDPGACVCCSVHLGLAQQRLVTCGYPSTLGTRQPAGLVAVCPLSWKRVALQPPRQQYPTQC